MVASHGQALAESSRRIRRGWRRLGARQWEHRRVAFWLPTAPTKHRGSRYGRETSARARRPDAGLRWGRRLLRDRWRLRASTSERRRVHWCGIQLPETLSFASTLLLGKSGVRYA